VSVTVLGWFLHRAALAALGVFVGAMLTEGFVLVPYWRSLAAREFFDWYRANDRRLFRFFGAVTIAAAIITVAAAAAAFWGADPNGALLAASAGLLLVTVGMFPLYFEKANAKFSAAAISSTDLAVELRRWERWHWARTGLAAAALVCSLVAANVA
jgi:O-antigen/teichoic acid export membrane protein